MICFLWKLGMGLVKGYQVTWQKSDRRGWYIVPPTISRGAPALVRRAREKSLSVRGAKIFNILPLHLRNHLGDFDLFKQHLNMFLEGIPDQPTIPGMGRAAATNSLLDQIPLLPLWDD